MLQKISNLGKKLDANQLKAINGGNFNGPCFFCFCDSSNPPPPESNCCCVNTW
ncbi:hypothetical protein [Aquimarina litoralis]|uniref:hypothetical protein n=1 Tax=Aquimarina litoralis TaxID=584605 RepID=UPI001C591CBC|nr:hypothetical protein [Aquimarina litoralis]